MAKFFFKNNKKSERPLHSQVAGIAWISVALLFITGLAIFLPKETSTATEDTCKTPSDTTVFEKNEHGKWRQPNRKKTTWKEKREHAATAESPSYSNSPAPARRQPLMVELNSADTTTLQLLHGIGPAYARRIVRYRERLGGFTSTEQLLEVYGFTPELLSHIAPHIKVDTLGINHISINSITLKQLIKHPYIEYYQARDIINLRNRGVHFNCADDLRAVPSMADSTLERLLPYILFD